MPLKPGWPIREHLKLDEEVQVVLLGGPKVCQRPLSLSEGRELYKGSPQLFSLRGILAIDAVGIMKFALNRSVQCRAISTPEQIRSLLGWLWFGTASALWGRSIFENDISARLAAGINI